MQPVWIIFWYGYLAAQLFLASFLVHPLILLLIYTMARLLGRRPSPTPFAEVKKEFQFGIVITAHREADLIPPIVDSLLKQTHRRFNVYVVADDCDTTHLHFPDTRIHILRPATPLNDQMASLDYGLQHLTDQDEVLVIFDPDNLAHPDFLRTLNAFYNSGSNAVYGRMRSKNTEDTYEQIDHWGASLSNFIERDMRSLLGFSANISGSGISVHKALYKKIKYDQRSRTGGFDKQLQLGIVKNIHRITYAREAVFYDEKVRDGNNFERQRTRWIAAHFKFLGNAFNLLWTGLRRRDGNLIYFAYNLVRPPYFILLGLSCFMMITDWFIDPRLSYAWLGCLAAFTLSFLLIVTKDVAHRSPGKILLYIPRIFYRQIRALTRLRFNKRSLLKTSHTRIVYIDDILRPSPTAPPSVTRSPSSAATLSSPTAPPSVTRSPSSTPASVTRSSSPVFPPFKAGALKPPPDPASSSQNPPPGYASSPPQPARDRTPDYGRSRSSAQGSP
jgi:glycosyltransferase involved in cell wall biosynthesis